MGLDRKRFLLKYAKSRKVYSILEIGVFNGNFTERLLELVTNNSPESKIYYLGIDLFAEGLTEEKYVSEISLYPQSLSNIQGKFSKFNNVTIDLIQGDSVNVLPKIPNDKIFDVIHIDGGHSYTTVLQDWLQVITLTKCKQ
jgi:SAM-dependent methyltransferase